MRQAQTREQLWAVVRNWKRAGYRIALVPTMGNLHAGHLALVAAAREHADRVITSIYVNPTQFGQGEDFERYPRTPDEDGRQLEEARCDLVFSPSDQTMYPNGLVDSTRLKAASPLADILEGASRPGHFDGVVTVVARLFNLVGPDVAVFGEKDYQQLLVIRRLVEDMGYPLQIVPVPILRNPRGLALSSRNRYLEDTLLGVAEQLNAVLDIAAHQVAVTPEAWREVERQMADQLADLGLRVDYVAVRRADDLSLPQAGDCDFRILAAVWCGDTRLIDNRACCLT